jgi:hypothetical protein
MTEKMTYPESSKYYPMKRPFALYPDEKWGEIPMAIVKRLPGCNNTEEDLLDFL